MPVEAKLELDNLSADGLQHKAVAITGAMAPPDNTNFPDPDPPLATVTAVAATLEGLLDEREAAEAHIKTLTQSIYATMEVLKGHLRKLGGYVEGVANEEGNTPAVATGIIVSAAMGVTGPKTPVGPMPKVTGLSGTPGDEPGEVDLHWHPVYRGLRSYILEMTTDPAAATGWVHVPNPTPGKSKCSIPGLPSATKAWFRVAAVGSAGQGPWSDPVQVTIP